MKKITKLLLLILVLGMAVGWSYPASAATEDDSGASEDGLHATIAGCYELIDDELVEVKELEADKVDFISATLKNVAEQTIDYWRPDQKYDNELYGIWFQLKLPAAISHDASGQVILESGACRRNYDDRWNTSDATLEVYAKDGQTLALEFAPGYCDANTLCWINGYHYYLRSEEDHSIVCGIHDSEYPIAPGKERKILLAVRTRDAQEFAVKRQLEEASHLRASLDVDSKSATSSIVSALPVIGDVMELPLVASSILSRPELGAQPCLTAQVKLPRWLEQQTNDQWWLQARCKSYTEDGNINFWAGLYNHEVIYDLDGDATQDLFDLRTLVVRLDDIEAWYLDAAGEKVALELSEVTSLPELSVEPSSSLVLEDNGISAKIALDGDLASELAGKTIYISYGYSRFCAD